MIIWWDKEFNEVMGKEVKIKNGRKDEMIDEGNCKEVLG